jgi:glucose/arabinose dehydrogenase
MKRSIPLPVMRRARTRSLATACVCAITLSLAASWSAVAQSDSQRMENQSAPQRRQQEPNAQQQAEPTKDCAADNGGITLSPGFCATVFADNLGHVRHMVVAPNGVLYVNTWSGRYYHNAPPPAGGFLIALSDSKGIGKADMIERFGAGVSEGSAGGTGIGLHNGALYAEQNDKILRFALPRDSTVPQEPPQVIVSGLPLTGDHPMHPFIIDSKGALFVDLGSATNSCQSDNRMPNVPGEDPCNELKTRAGTWRYDTDSTDQHFSPNERFATGLRNGEGFAFDPDGRCSPLNMAVINSARTGRNYIQPKRARGSRRRNSYYSRKGPITAGRNAITIAFNRSLYWHPNTVVTEARRSVSAPTKSARLRLSPDIGRLTIS